MDIRKYRVRSADLRKNCSSSFFKFTSTADVKPITGIMGQERAIRSLEFGLDMENPSYNIYLAGTFGTGKTTLANIMVEAKAGGKPVPSDWCYVFNYKSPDCPKVLELPAGKGHEFKKDTSRQINKMIVQMIRTFESDSYEAKKTEIINGFAEQTGRMYMQLEEEARGFGFAISRTEQGINSIPLKEGEALSQDDYIAMSEEDRDDLKRRSLIIQEKLGYALRQYKEMEKNYKIKVRELEQETIRSVTAPCFIYLFGKYRLFEKIVEYLEDMQQDILENIEVFIKQEDNTAANFFRNINRRNMLRRYQVNLIVDNSELKQAPVIFENNPTYANLCGQIEYEGEFGILATDFSKIKAGSIHKANGGYLVLHVNDILKNIFVWDTLKRVLKTGEARVESAARMFGISNSESLQPEPIPINLKVILIGETDHYYMLYAYDEEFRKLFKLRADFDIDMERSHKALHQYANFIGSVCKRKHIRHFKPEAVAAVVDYGSRIAEDKTKLTTRFNKLVEIISEAGYWAKRDNQDLVGAEHVRRAIDEKRYRSSMWKEHLQEYMERGILMINTMGYKVGEINGLVVYQMGDYNFGKPARITAKTFMGEKGLVNIEREIRMSGNIHSKGVLTLNGYIGAQYAQNKPLSLSASLTFEQSYSGIEGDSASSAELYALLSSIAGVPINQGIAVTGSVNQNGEVQPVGGVNQKIEGFFAVCKNRGLDGKQGVIIPRANLSQLMLHDEIVQAVKNRKFNVWAVEHIDEGIEILMGIPAGKRTEIGKFPPGTLHHLADMKLQEWSDKRKPGMDLAALRLRRRPGLGIRRREW